LDIIQYITKELGFSTPQISNTIELHKNGATVPFIARYRKEKTGNLTETEIRLILEKYSYYTELEERKVAILDSIQKQKRLTPALKNAIESASGKTELEDIYLPFRPRKMTRGKKASDAGLEPFAYKILNCKECNFNIRKEAEQFLTQQSSNQNFDTTEKIICGACDIIAENLSNNAGIRKQLRTLAHEKGFLTASVKKDYASQKTKFEMYYNYKEPIKNPTSHRILAMFRGEKEKILALKLQIPENSAAGIVSESLPSTPNHLIKTLFKQTAEDALNRLLIPATEREIRNTLFSLAEEEAFTVFGDNLKNLLLAAPAGRKSVIGLDPGFRTGCKMVVIDNTGKLTDNYTIYPTPPKNDIQGTRKTITGCIEKYKIQLIAIGNGTAGRETEKIIREIVKEIPEKLRPLVIMVNESGASVYSASQTAIDEFPDYDITVRGAVSIARRLQDPLSELVKIDPKAIGVGQYQHDLNQSRLKKSLENIVESCVNSVGVNLNLASAELLKYVSGLNKKLADNIVKYRDINGAFSSRKQLKKVPGIGNKTYEQAAGFLRIENAETPLDNSAVHPERYKLVKKMADDINSTVKELIGNDILINKIELKNYITEDSGIPTLKDIIDELKKPGRDPRKEFRYAQFDDEIREIEDLHAGMKLEGVITNVTDFGAFVDIGVHQDGLVHISQLADHFVKSPADIVKAGQIVTVKVLETDPDRKRISLSMKNLNSY